MNFNVPQYIDIEDKIAFQLTAKQLGWFAIGGVILFFVWKTEVQQGVFALWAIIIGGLSCAFAFYKPHGLTFVSFLGHAFMYLVRPKMLVWRREASLGDKNDFKNRETSVKKTEEKVLNDSVRQEMANMAEMLDARR